MDPNNLDLATEAEFEAWQNSQWQLARFLSNAILDGDIFTVDEKVQDGNVTYKLPLNDFLGIKDKEGTRGKGFYDSECTKNVRLDDDDQYTIKFEARSHGDADDWTTEKLNLRPYLKMRHGILFGGDAAPAMVVQRTVGDSSGQDTYEVSSAEARTFVSYDEKEAADRKEEQEAQQEEAYESHPDHEPVAQEGQAQGQLVANGIFADAYKVGKFISLIMHGNPHPGKKRYRTDAKGHRYFGCEKHEHDLNAGTWKNVCT